MTHGVHRGRNRFVFFVERGMMVSGVMIGARRGSVVVRASPGEFWSLDLGPRIWFARSAQMKVHEILKLLRDDEWYLVVTRGSHRQFKHPTKPGRVTVAGKLRHDIPPGTLNSIFKQANLKR